ncbi:MAG: 2-oxo acid dehydrogenase subunit E2 [Phycisphaerales bacterium]|nr:2-oxo acid dehydrogenase subunit E2 [Phycisphaerales bacterium]
MATKQPDDKSHFILPDLGEGVHEAELVKWRVKPGDRVDEHQTIAEMETDKALVEVPSPWSGVIKDLNGSEGEILNVGCVLVTYDVADAPVQTNEFAGETQVPEASEDAGTVVGSVDATLSVPASFRREATEAPNPALKPLATPAVRRIAREMSVDINTVQGTGRGGRVTASDIERVAGGSAAPAARRPAATAHGTDQPHTSTPAAIPAAPVAASPDPATADADLPLATRVSTPLEGVSERIPFRGVRRKIAQSLLHSVQTTVHFTVVDEADVTALDRKRQGLEQLLGRKLSLLPFVMSAVCRALRTHPTLNATVDDFVDEILIRSVVNLGCAVDTDHGLMVPVLSDADNMSVVQLADAVQAAAKGCRDRTIDREQLTGGTFTISNVGSYGGAFATPIINYPEVAILAAGRAKEKVLTRDGAFYAGLVLPLSLSCDHRVVDGAEGARFLNTLVGLLEAPDKLLPDV